MAILKPSPGLPISAEAGRRRPSKREAGERVGGDGLQPLGDGQAGGVGGEEEGGEAAGAGGFAGAGEDGVEVGDAAVGDPGLLAVEDVAVAVAGGGGGGGGDVGAGLRLGQGEGGEGAAGAGLGEPAALLVGGAEQRDGAGAEALHREGEVGEAVVAGQGLADQAEAADVERRRGVGVDRGVGEPAVAAERGDERLAGGVGVGMVDVGEVLRRPGVEVERQRLVAGLEERPVEEAAVGHQSPSNTGFALATKAS